MLVATASTADLLESRSIASVGQCTAICTSGAPWVAKSVQSLGLGPKTKMTNAELDVQTGLRTELTRDWRDQGPKWPHTVYTDPPDPRSIPVHINHALAKHYPRKVWLLSTYWLSTN